MIQLLKKSEAAIILVILGVILMISSAAVYAAQKPALTVAAAANLKRAYTDMGAAFTAKYQIPVTFIFGSTGDLKTQITNGAPVDAFAAADVKSVSGLAEAALIDSGSVKTYAQGSLVLVARKGVKLPQYLSQLTDKNIKVIAIGNPKLAPYGKAAVEALVAAGIWPKIQDKVVYGKNIDETYTYVKTGNADVAIIGRSMVYGTAEKYVENKFWDTLHKPLIQGMGVVTASTNKAAASQFEKFVLSAEGQKILLKFGYTIPKQ